MYINISILCIIYQSDASEWSTGHRGYPRLGNTPLPAIKHKCRASKEQVPVPKLQSATSGPSILCVICFSCAVLIIFVLTYGLGHTSSCCLKSDNYETFMQHQINQWKIHIG